MSKLLPQPLPQECVKATKILQSFISSGSGGLDGVIPREVLSKAKGFAIFSVVKAGFLFSARAGTGIVIARLDDGSWSAPSAIGTAGMGFGGQAGAEMTDFLIVLNSRSAVKSFMAAGSLTLGGNLSIALGPLGRNGEASGSLNSKGKMAAMYSYSRTKGLFGGISVEGSVIVERQDANAQAYKEDVSVKQLLGGEVEFPPWGEGLRRALESSAGGIWVNGWVDDRPRSRSGSPGAGTGYAFEGIGVGKDVTGSSASSRDGGGSLGRKKSSSFSGWGMGGKKSSSISSPVPFDPTLDDPSHRTSNSISSPKPKLSKTKPTPKSILDEPNPFDSSDPYTISDGMANLALSNARKRDRETNPGFSTHFDSDFDPTAPHPTSHSRSNSNSNSNSQSYPHSSITKKDSFDEDFDLPSSTHPQDKRNSFEEDFTFPSNPPPLKKLPFSSGVALGGLYTTSTKKTPLPKPLLSRTGSSSPGLGAGLFKNASNPFQFRPITPPGQTQPSTPPLNSYAVYSRGGVQRRLSQKKTLLDDDEEEDAGEGKGIALFDFKAQQNGDLSFNKNDVIVILRKSDSSDDWWTGRIGSREGIFPANFVEVV